MQAINNSGLLTICNVCGLTGFAPAIGYVYDPTGETITITDASTFGAGDGMKIEHLYVTDADGKVMYASIGAADGSHELVHRLPVTWAISTKLSFPNHNRPNKQFIKLLNKKRWTLLQYCPC